MGTGIHTMDQNKMRVWYSRELVDNPNITDIINYSNKLSVIKYDTVYNKQVESENTIKSLKELSEKVKEIQDEFVFVWNYKSIW